MQAAPMLGKYRLLAELGQGGMAKVYLALVKGPAGFNKLVVLKEIHAQLAEDPDVVTMFLDEARLAARLNHPNVVQTNEVGHEEGHYFIAMEYLEGQTFNRIFNRLRGQMSLAMQLRALAEALHGLDYAHELRDFDGTPLGVVHRDVSPHNIFVTYSGQVKVVDFGIAKALTSASETRTGMLKGKAAYMAPEQARGERVDRRADVYAIGVMLWEIVAGRRMFKGIPEVAILTKLVLGEVPSAAEAAPDLPARLAAILDRSLAKKREDRFPTAAALAYELEAFADEIGDKSGVRELGRMVSEQFAGDRAKVDAIVEQQLKAPPEAGLPMLDHPSTIHTGAYPQGGGQDFHGTPSGSLSLGGAVRSRSSTDVSMQQPLVFPTKPASSKRVLVGLALFAVAGAAATIVALQLRGPTTPVEASQSTNATATESSFTLRIETNPAGATVRDGERVLGSTPLTMTVEGGAEPRELIALMDGYTPYTLKVPTLAADLELRADLAAAPQPSDQAVSAEPTAPEVEETSKPNVKVGGGAKRPPVVKTSTTPNTSTPLPDIRLKR